MYAPVFSNLPASLSASDPATSRRGMPILDPVWVRFEPDVCHQHVTALVAAVEFAAAGPLGPRAGSRIRLSDANRDEASA